MAPGWRWASRLSNRRWLIALAAGVFVAVVIVAGVWSVGMARLQPQQPTFVPASDARPISPGKTYVLFTIDTEETARFVNGMWSVAVNGHLPANLDALVQAGTLMKVDGGYLLSSDYFKTMPAMGDGQSVAGQSTQEWLDSAVGGLPLIMRLLKKYDFPAVLVVDAAGLYSAGAGPFAETCRHAEELGHEIGLHFHMNPVFMADDYGWFRERGIPAPQPGQNPGLFTPEVAGPLFHELVKDVEKACGTEMITFRGGAYYSSEAIDDQLIKEGFRFDATPNPMVTLRPRANLALARPIDNAPFPYRGLVIVPVTGFVRGIDPAVLFFAEQYSAVNDSFLLPALQQAHAQGTRVVTYILHSFSMMDRLPAGADGTPSPGYALGPGNPRHLRVFEQQLKYIKDHPDDFEVVDFHTLWKKLHEDPTILHGAGALPWAYLDEAQKGQSLSTIDKHFEDVAD
jgi:hypothetical protein